MQRDVVDVDVAVDDADGVAFFGDDPLDERLVRIERVVEHHDVAAARLADPVDQLVDDQPILILQRRRHALALDARDLKTERHDEHRVDGRRDQRLDPGDQLLLAPAPTGARAGEARSAIAATESRDRARRGCDPAADATASGTPAADASACG